MIPRARRTLRRWTTRLNLAFVAPVGVAAPGHRISWEAPDGCPTVEDVRAQADALVGATDAVAAESVPVDIGFAVTTSGPLRFVLDAQLRVGDETGTRHLETDSCAAAAEAAALMVAIAVDRSAALGRQRREERRLGLTTQALAGVGLGALPRTTAVVQLDLGIRSRSWAVRLGPSLWTPRTTLGPDGEIGGRFTLWTVDATACGIPHAGRVEFPLCAGPLAGAMHAVGVGPLRPRRARSPWMGIHAGPGVRVRAIPVLSVVFGIRAIAVVGAELRRSRGDALCCRSNFGATLSLGLEIRRPSTKIR